MVRELEKIVSSGELGKIIQVTIPNATREYR